MNILFQFFRFVKDFRSKRGKKEYEETIYYIGSTQEIAETFAEKIQALSL